MNKKLMAIGVGVLVVFAGVYIIIFWVTNSCGGKADTIRATVEHWNPGKRALKVRTGAFCRVTIAVTLPTTSIIVPVTKSDQPLEEQLVRQEFSQTYINGFCPGDHVELTRNTGWQAVSTGTTIEVNRVRNLGPRSCGL